jgi:hypothetical protein
MSAEFSYPKGSEWSKWDLQVQTILDERYVSLSAYYEQLKKQDAELWKDFTLKVGGEKNALLYDSKAYFSDNSIAKKERCANYARTLFSFLNTFSNSLGSRSEG